MVIVKTIVMEDKNKKDIYLHMQEVDKWVKEFREFMGSYVNARTIEKMESDFVVQELNSEPKCLN